MRLLAKSFAVDDDTSPCLDSWANSWRGDTLHEYSKQLADENSRSDRAMAETPGFR
jgi:hypothetical protein